MAKSGLTPEQRFKKLFDLANDETTTQAERDAAQRKWREWLKRRGKKAIDVSAILAQAERDDAAANPPPPPPPPSRAGVPHPFDGTKYDPATLVEQVASKYLVMRPHVRVIYTLWIIATHVHDKFRIAPRVLLTSEEPESGKTTALEVARCLMFQANEETFATAAAIRGSGANSRRRKASRVVLSRLQAWSTAFHTAGASRPWTPRRPSPNCPLRMRCINSIPAIVIAAVAKPLKPSIVAIRCFTPRWSCSIRLFKYFDDRSFVSAGSKPSAFSSRTAR
jgi:hypothetical protein